MLRSSAFRLLSYQAVAFYPSLKLSIRKILPALLEQIGDVLDGEPLTFPLPLAEELPAELPRIIFQNKSGSLRFDVSPLRADARWNRQTVEEEPPPQFLDFSRKAI